ncbi:hypothetical protein BGZ89_000837 [Linnemannia elongata]|nr:hypothetical protein BGZ90_007911 [Linnemannia elongata]KAG0070357.1 hypothetical protein BGZ89_000837 [Linnemannia elongata]
MTTIGYPYTLPTTANVSFQEYFAPNANAQYQRPLSDATAFRGRLRTALKEHKHSDRHDFLNIQKAVEDYLPLVFGLVAGIESTELQLTNDIETTWRCTISNVALSLKMPRIKNKSIHYEAIFTLLTLGYALMDRANELSFTVQRKILIAIGDVSTYVGGYGDGTSMKGSGLTSSLGNSTLSDSGGHDHGLNSTSIGSGGATKQSGVANATSRLFKKSSNTSSKAAKNSNTIGEFTDYLNDEDLAGMDHQLTTAADLYCRAAGVFEYVVQEMIPRWNEFKPAVVISVKDSSASNKKAGVETSRPVDVQTSVVSAHIRLALAEAHACTVRKASIKAARASAIKLSTPGSGATAQSGGAVSKTSYGLLAKLTVGVKEEYERAYGLLKAVKDQNEISTEFRTHVKDGKFYYEALAQVLLGMDAYEAQQYGKAIGFLSVARATFLALAKSSKSHTIAQSAAFEYRLANEKVIAFQKINDSVTFEKVPSAAELLGLMPSGRELLSVKRYPAPKPSFGSAAAAREGSADGGDDGVNKITYALEGAYF